MFADNTHWYNECMLYYIGIYVLYPANKGRRHYQKNFFEKWVAACNQEQLLFKKHFLKFPLHSPSWTNFKITVKVTLTSAILIKPINFILS